MEVLSLRALSLCPHAAGWEVRIIKALEVHVEDHRAMLLASDHLPLNLCVQQKVTSKLPMLLC